MSEHFLIGIELVPDKLRIQGYAIRPIGASALDVMDEMVKQAELAAKKLSILFMPFVLVTGPLQEDTVKEVQQAVSQLDPAISEYIATAKDWHTTIWIANPADDPTAGLWHYH